VLSTFFSGAQSFTKILKPAATLSKGIASRQLQWQYCVFYY